MSPFGSLRQAAQARRLLSPALRSWYRLTVLGDSNVPKTGRVILLANHLGFLDAAVVAASSPRPVRTLAPDELFEPPLDRMAAAAGQISIRPGGPDLEAMSISRSVLAADEVLAVFAEGARGDGRVAHMRHEAALLALIERSPVVPVALLGTRRTGMAADALPKRNSRVAVVFGQPFVLRTSDEVYRRSVIATAGETMRQRLADHVRSSEELVGIRLPDDIPPPVITRASEQRAARPAEERAP